jgi:dolichyl-phosphate-mannose-protein mannosyltransferase
MLGFAFMLDHVLLRRFSSQVTRWLVTAAFSTLVIGVFVFFAPLAYGYDKPSSDLKNRQWLSTWNLCD